jgi:hypothetical protein
MPHKPTKLPYTMGGTQDDVALSPAVGGPVLPFTAGAALLIGDAVYLSAADTVNKAAVTATLGTSFVGIVVGGADYASDGSCITDDVNQAIAVGGAAAGTGERVLVQVSGVAYAIAGASITAGVALMGSAAVAGRVITNAAGTFGQLVGTAITTQVTAGSPVKILIDHR